jgi:hypothetical protein
MFGGSDSEVLAPEDKGDLDNLFFNFFVFPMLFQFAKYFLTRD